MSRLYRKLAYKLMSSSGRISPEAHREWVAAMTAELEYLSSDSEALNFAFGCFIATISEVLNMQNLKPVLRWGVAIFAFSWATAKLYLIAMFIRNAGRADFIATPEVLYSVLVFAAVGYVACAYALISRKYLLVAAGLCLALAANSLLFGFAQIQFFFSDFQASENLTRFLALVSEEYFMWTVLVLGTTILMFLSDLKRSTKSVRY